MIFPMVLLLAVSTMNASNNLSYLEKNSLQLAKKFINGKDKAYYKPDGSVVFLHGGTLPSVLAAPLRVTDIALEPGENIKEVQIGDTVRWMISPAISGSGKSEISHVIIKPTEKGLETTLAIYTDRRSYHINLKSTQKKYFPLVSFAYKKQLSAQWSAYKKQKRDQTNASKFATGDGVTNIDNLNFNYKIKGSTRWRPVRVYNNGRKTYIEMPSYIKSMEVPALVVLDRHNKKQLVNYRYKNGKFIVDKIFDNAALIMGVGRDQSKVIISRKNSSNSNSLLDLFDLN